MRLFQRFEIIVFVKVFVIAVMPAVPPIKIQVQPEQVKSDTEGVRPAAFQVETAVFFKFAKINVRLDPPMFACSDFTLRLPAVIV